jgi:beta-lactamase class A
VKNKLRLFRFGRKTYFHHQNGVFIRKNRLQQTAFSTSLLMFAASGFFVAYEYGLPAFRSSYFQSQKSIQTDAPVPVEQEPSEIVQTPIEQEDELLKLAINDKLATFPSTQKWSVFVHDLNSDRTVNINVDDEYDSASLYKLFLLEALEHKLPHDEWKRTNVGKTKISQCLESMLKVADNPCSEPLVEYLGGEYVDEINQKNGFVKTSVAGASGRKTTPSEVGELLIRLKKGHILSDKSRRFVFDALYQQTYSKGIPSGCINCRTANKSGELNSVSHDAGVVTHGANSYVLVIMSEGGTFEQITDLTRLIDSRYSSDSTSQTP